MRPHTRISSYHRKAEVILEKGHLSGGRWSEILGDYQLTCLLLINAAFSEESHVQAQVGEQNLTRLTGQQKQEID